MSELRTTTISDLAGTGPVTLTKQSAAKAWVNFNGEGSIATRGSFNTSSIVDLNTGSYAQNFSSSFNGGDNYASHSTADDENWGNKTAIYYQTASEARMQVFQGSIDTNSAIDTYRAMMTHHGDLA